MGLDCRDRRVLWKSYRQVAEILCTCKLRSLTDIFRTQYSSHDRELIIARSWALIEHRWVLLCTSLYCGRVEYLGEQDNVKMVVDVSAQNKDEALLDMLLGLVIILELCIFVALLHRNTAKILVAPLERIFNTIRTNASQIINALEETDEVSREAK